MFGSRVLSRRQVLLALSLFWTVGAVFLVLAWLQSGDVARERHAPACAPEQVFTTVECRATLDGTVTAMTNHRIDLRVADRAVTAPIAVNGDVTDNEGTAVRVTFYRGRVIHVVGPNIRVDSTDTATDGYEFRRRSGFFFMGGGTVLAAANLAIGEVRRRVRRPAVTGRGPR